MVFERPKRLLVFFKNANFFLPGKLGLVLSAQILKLRACIQNTIDSFSTMTTMLVPDLRSLPCCWFCLERRWPLHDNPIPNQTSPLPTTPPTSSSNPSRNQETDLTHSACLPPHISASQSISGCASQYSASGSLPASNVYLAASSGTYTFGSPLAAAASASSCTWQLLSIRVYR